MDKVTLIQNIKQFLLSEIDKINNIKSEEDFSKFSSFLMDYLSEKYFEKYDEHISHILKILGKDFRNFLINRYGKDYIFDSEVELTHYFINEILGINKVFFNPKNIIDKFKKYDTFIGVSDFKPVFKIGNKLAIIVYDCNNITENSLKNLSFLLNPCIKETLFGHYEKNILNNEEYFIFGFKLPINIFNNVNFNVSEKEIELFNKFIKIATSKGGDVEIKKYNLEFSIYDDITFVVITGKKYLELTFKNSSEMEKVYIFLRTVYGNDFIKKLLLEIV